MPKIALLVGLAMGALAMVGCAAIMPEQTRQSGVCARDALAATDWAHDVAIYYAGRAVVTLHYSVPNGQEATVRVVIYRDVIENFDDTDGYSYERLKKLLFAKCHVYKPTIIVD